MIRRTVLTRTLCALLCLVCLLTALPLTAHAEEAQEVPIAERMAQAKQEIRELQAGRYGMVPVYGTDIEDGTYEIEVDSSSPFFRITHAELIVEDHVMTARFTISSLSYAYVYPGSVKQAQLISESQYIPGEESDGKTVFTFPVEALDTGLKCAAFSKKKQQWYDRTLVFMASSLPAEALHVDLPDYDLIEAAILAYDTQAQEKAGETGPHTVPEPVSVDRFDGEYSVEVNMVGGSGRASISSPTLLIVREGKAYARLLWSSTYYDYMIVGGERYEPVNTTGNSVFEIPLWCVDEPMSVIADTTAMSTPHEIEYDII